VQGAANLIGRLNETAPKLDAAIGEVGQAAGRVGPLAEKLETLATNVDGVVSVIDRQRVARIVENVDSFTQTLGDNRAVVGEALQDAARLVGRLNETAPKLDAALGDIRTLTQAFDAVRVGRSVENLDRFTQALGRSGDDVEKTLAEARSLAEKLNRSADRVDGVLKAAEAFLGSAAGEEGRSTFEEIREAARSIRELADNLDRRTSEITTGVTRFTGSGLREVEAFATEGRRTLNEIGRAVKSLERNPQQLLFGGRPSIPEYNGRR
jgi:phospholipid/cholesterol/gamma-HCH transport system substrate-binding protein